MEDIAVTKTTTKSPSDAHAFVITECAPPLARWGYKLTSNTPESLVFERSYRPWYVWLLVILLFPIGLLFLLVKTEVLITCAMAGQQDGGSKITFAGEADKKITTAIETMVI